MEFDALPDPEERAARPATPPPPSKPRPEPVAGIWIVFAFSCAVAAALPLAEAAKLPWQAGPCALGAIVACAAAWRSRRRLWACLAALALGALASWGAFEAGAEAISHWSNLPAPSRSSALNAFASSALWAAGCSAGFAAWNKIRGGAGWIGAAVCAGCAMAWILGAP